MIIRGKAYILAHNIPLQYKISMITCFIDNSLTLQLNYLYYCANNCSKYQNLFTVGLNVISLIKFDVTFISYNYCSNGSGYWNYYVSLLTELAYVSCTIMTFIYWSGIEIYRMVLNKRNRKQDYNGKEFIYLIDLLLLENLHKINAYILSLSKWVYKFILQLLTMSLVQNHTKPTKHHKSISGKESIGTNIINPAFLRRLKFNKSPHMTTPQNNTLVIDPWHVNEEDKIKERSGFGGDYAGNEHLLDKGIQFGSQRKFLKQYKNNFDKFNHSERITRHFQNINQTYNFSPSKFDILESSFQFYQDEHENLYKTHKYVIKQAHMNHNQGPNIDRNIKNFIKKNIRNAFCIQNQIPQPNSNLNAKINKTKTFCNEAKQRLLLNNEKLKQSSKQLSRFISMKDSTPKPSSAACNNNESNYTFKIPIESIWNFSYVEKQLNPEHYSTNHFKKMLVKCGQGKSQQTKHRTESFTKTSESFSTPFQQIKVAKSQNQISRKLSRLYQAKKKLALVIEGEGQQSRMESKFAAGKINNDSQSRIHSLTRNNKGNNEEIGFNSWLNDAESQQQLGLQRNRACKNQQKTKKFLQLQRSFSAKILNKIKQK